MAEKHHQVGTTNEPAVSLKNAQFKRGNPIEPHPNMPPGTGGSIHFPPGSDIRYHMDRDVPIMSSVVSSLMNQNPAFRQAQENTTIHFVFVNDIAGTAKSKLTAAESTAVNAAGNRSFVVQSGKGKSSTTEFFVDASVLLREDSKPFNVYAQLLAEMDRSLRHLSRLHAPTANQNLNTVIKEVNGETLANLKKIAASPQLMEEMFSASPNSASPVLRQVGKQLLDRLNEEIARESAPPGKSPLPKAPVPVPKKLPPEKGKNIA